MTDDYKVWPRPNGYWYYKLQGERNYHTTHCRTEEEAREYAEAVRYQLLDSNPARKIDPFASNHTQRDIYDEKELQALFPLDMDRFFQVWKLFKKCSYLIKFWSY